MMHNFHNSKLKIDFRIEFEHNCRKQQDVAQKKIGDPIAFLRQFNHVTDGVTFLLLNYLIEVLLLLIDVVYRNLIHYTTDTDL